MATMMFPALETRGDVAALPQPSFAPGWPGEPSTWTSGAKDGVGTALDEESRVWFTIARGIVTEVFYPEVDCPCTRDLGLIVTGGDSFFSDERKDAHSTIGYVEQGAPAYRLTNTCWSSRYVIHKEVYCDPRRSAVLQTVRFVPKGRLDDYRLYVLLTPHLGDRGTGNTAWIDVLDGEIQLLARRDEHVLALAGSAPWREATAGFVGSPSCPWHQLREHGRLVETYRCAENGNVSLVGEVDLQACQGRFALALGFASNTAEASAAAQAAAHQDIPRAKAQFIDAWRRWGESLAEGTKTGQDDRAITRTSSMVLRCHEAKSHPGAFVASLAKPWGSAQSDELDGGYHLVWPRDLVEIAGGLLSVGAHAEVHRTLLYLESVQQGDGHWHRNTWTDGRPLGQGLQMDDTALVVLLVDAARRQGALIDADVSRLWTMVRKAAGFIARNGPVAADDRWEHEPGYSPFTLACEVAGLLAAADLADVNGEPSVADYLRETADAWNASIDRWTYVVGTELAARFGVEGCYVRAEPLKGGSQIMPADRKEQHGRRSSGVTGTTCNHVVSHDALALVRFGLRAAGDPRIENTLKVIDGLLRLETPYGPAWRRSNCDRYGENADGIFDVEHGIGRAWPLLTGQRAHYELAAGRPAVARSLLAAMRGLAGEAGMLPEQVWDAADLPGRRLFLGRPTGAAMPLARAHAEYLKLQRSLADDAVFDLPPQAARRYLRGRCQPPPVIWRFNHKRRSIERGRSLRIETLAAANIHWTGDGWRSSHDTPSRNSGLGVHFADLALAELAQGERVEFTFHWDGANRWEGRNFELTIE
jgi:glucoamylase